ncbi:glutamine--fructose-6-phosphate transaminase (isomerizing) [Vallitalea okinawensis]|uniref:glutamine--fructose-6-phosphate transaminase (isomerizing) n=1 Tax=Vallitalea okinawensis TaxID=2078660 RepID=UPI000CFAFAF1|nr:glutamine--fructose-6-phosphate transaminase (isomerizing) [Vallitalea okinawensis]
MCGIVGYIGKNPAQSILIEGLKRLEYRGYDSAGIAIYNQEDINIMKTKGRLANLEEKLDGNHLEGTIGIGHTRWATHGAPSDHNSHPHASHNDKIVIVHNGIIENYMELRDELIEKGYAFKSETDTETVSHLVFDYYKESNDLFEAVMKAIKRLEGSYALGVLCKDNPEELIAARKDSPLIIGKGDGENFIASDIPAILEHTRDIYLLENGEAAVIKRDSIEIFDMEEKTVEKEIFHVDWDIASAEKGGYDHFMLKEIFEQPQVVKDTLLPRLTDKGVQLDDINLNKEDLDKINKIYMVACGTASYACLVGKYLLERVARVPVVAEVASEFRYREPILDENTLVIVVSQSGETADTLAALRMAKDAGARVMAVVNVVGSSIARDADDIFYTLAGPEIAVASTKAYSCQLGAMYLIAAHIAILKGKMSMEEYKELKDELMSIPDKIEKILDQQDAIKTLAEEYIAAKNVFYIGRGLDFAVCMEGSLKLKEIAYVHSEPYAAGELKHGPIALIEDDTLVFGIVTQEELNEKTISNLKEVKARGASIITIALEGNEKAKKISDHVIYVPRTHWMLTSILANIPQQLFAYYVSVGLGHDVDKPRNLAKSVTVE